MENKLYLASSILFIIAALGFFIAANIGNNIFIAIGVLWLCIGTLFFIKSRKSKNK